MIGRKVAFGKLNHAQSTCYVYYCLKEDNSRFLLQFLISISICFDYPTVFGASLV